MTAKNVKSVSNYLPFSYKHDTVIQDPTVFMLIFQWKDT